MMSGWGGRRPMQSVKVPPRSMAIWMPRWGGEGDIFVVVVVEGLEM